MTAIEFRCAYCKKVITDDPIIVKVPRKTAGQWITLAVAIAAALVISPVTKLELTNKKAAEKQRAKMPRWITLYFHSQYELAEILAARSLGAFAQ